MKPVEAASVGSIVPYCGSCASGGAEHVEGAGPSGGVGKGEGAPLRILVAEDDPVSQLVMRGLLEKAGHQVRVASDGLEALSLWLEGEFDLVLMDLQMPNMDGTETTRAIRELELARGGRPSVIVAVTAYAAEEHRRRCLEAGMDEFLSKPVSAEALRWTVAFSRRLRRGN